jgi:hypothetical protein
LQEGLEGERLLRTSKKDQVLLAVLLEVEGKRDLTVEVVADVIVVSVSAQQCLLFEVQRRELSLQLRGRSAVQGFMKFS